VFSDITIEELVAEKRRMTMIDVRSPSEYKDSTVPGSMNIPIFTDEERAEVGIIYKKIGSEAAEERGLKIFSAKLPAFIKSFKQIEGEKTVFCWRGGMRSRTAATVLDLMKIHVHRLDGGFRAYRKWVVEQLDTLVLKPKAYILNGYTGTGKTTILQRLEQEGYPVLDFEVMANHRGSIFGQIGLDPNNQKTFDALLVEKLQEIQECPYVFFEGESKRIGKVLLPEQFYDVKENGTQIFVEMPMEERVQHILEDYRPWEFKEECMEAFQRIKSRIHTPIAAEIQKALLNEEFSVAVRLLLEYYYDPRYQHSSSQYSKINKITVSVQNMDDAVTAIKEIVVNKKELTS